MTTHQLMLGATPTAAPPVTADPYFDYVTMLLHGDGTNGAQNNTFIDSSTNNLAITRVGNTTQGTFSPYGENWSNYFAGATNYLNATSSSLNLTANFTVEAWVNPASWASPNGIFFNGTFANDTGRVQLYVRTDGKLESYINNSTDTVFLVLTSTNTVPIGEWTHVAYTVSGTTARIFINGTLEASGTYSGARIAQNNFYIGYARSAATNRFFTGYISNLRAVTGTALYTSSFTPSTTPLEAVSGTALLTCQSSRFVDNSANRLALTLTGTPSVQRFSPFAPVVATPYYSAYMDGNNDYIQASYNSAFDVAGGTFTVECWVCITGLFTANIDGNRVGCISEFGPSTAGVGWEFTVNQTNNTITFAVQGSGTNAITGSATLSFNTWYHIAVVRNGTTNTIYVNGTSVTLTVNAYTGASATSGSITVGSARRFANYSHDFLGYISNFRLVKGSAVYTSNFTPSTIPLTNITNTSLLTCQSNTFIDNSSNNFAISAVSNPTPSTFAPFTVSYTAQEYSPSVIGGSSYMDSSGDWLTVANNTALALPGNFTFEFWIYSIALIGTNYFYVTLGNENAGFSGLAIFGQNTNMGVYSNGANVISVTTALKLGAWQHVAVVRNGTTIKFYLDGVEKGSATNSTSFTGVAGNGLGIGTEYNGSYLSRTNGYFSGFRLVKGTAVYTANFAPPTTPPTAITNTSLLVNFTNGGIFDNAEMQDLETFGNVQINTSVVKYGTGSIAFDGSGDYTLNRYIPALFDWWKGNFTLEAWIYPTTYTGWYYLDGANNKGTLIGNNAATSATNYWSFGLNSSGNLWFAYFNGTSQGGGSSQTVPLNTWTHVAMVKNGTNITLYVNGVGTSLGNVVGTPQSSTTVSLLIGVGNNNYINGYVDDLRITNGIARYTANFTPPTAAFPNY